MTMTLQPAANLETLVRRHQAGVWRFLRLLGCGRDEADDLTQETFLVVLRRRFAERSERETAHYLRRVARSRFVDRRRRDRRDLERRAEIAEEVWVASVEDSDAGPWLEALRHCVAALEASQREAVELFYGERLSRRVIAKRLSLEETGVKTMLQRVRARLRRCVERRIAAETRSEG